MNRREFLTASAAGLASAALPNLSFAAATRPKVEVVRLAEDRFELITSNPSSIRIMQLTDTHFGRPDDEDRATDALTRKSIRKLVDEQKPDFIFHTGDFINNDVERVEHAAIDFMNDLGTPWSLVFGNHDHATGRQGGLTLDDYYKRLENHAMGYHTVTQDGKSRRDYCFRIDIRSAKSAPVMSLFGFNSGGNGPCKVDGTQLDWLRAQLESDASKGHKQPILVMQHIPTVEYNEAFAEKSIFGRHGENVCFEQDKGEAFEMYRASGRVKGIFCGHDHINDYIGNHKGIRLVYGRVSGWSGYGDWQRGARIIEPTQNLQDFRTRVVIPKGLDEKPEWMQTFKNV